MRAGDLISDWSSDETHGPRRLSITFCFVMLVLNEALIPRNNDTFGSRRPVGLARRQAAPSRR